MDYKKIVSADEYYTVKDLRYSDSLGMKLSSANLEDLFDYKDTLISEGSLGFYDTDLHSFNSKFIFNNKHKELVRMYEEYVDLLQTSLEYGLCYLQIKETEDKLADRGERLTGTDEAYFKKILISSRYKHFSWKDFSGFINTDISKQGALKALNKLEELGILGSTKNTRGEKQFSATIEWE